MWHACVLPLQPFPWRRHHRQWIWELNRNTRRICWAHSLAGQGITCPCSFAFPLISQCRRHALLYVNKSSFSTSMKLCTFASLMATSVRLSPYTVVDLNPCWSKYLWIVRSAGASPSTQHSPQNWALVQHRTLNKSSKGQHSQRCTQWITPNPGTQVLHFCLESHHRQVWLLGSAIHSADVPGDFGDSVCVTSPVSFHVVIVPSVPKDYRGEWYQTVIQYR